MPLKIDPEFEALIPPLSTEEYNGLEASLQAQGCHTPIVVWDGVIIDGHNRYELCTKHGIDFDTMPREFTDRREARIWIIRNQFDRRNLDATARMDLALLLKSDIQAQAQERMKAGVKVDPVENLPQGTKSRDTLAAMAGVSGRTLDKYEAVRETAAPELLQATRDGRLSVHAASQAAKTLTKEEQIEILKTAPGKIGDVVRKEIARAKEIQEANAWCDEMNAKFRPPDYDPKAERERVHTTHQLYNSLEAITKLPEPSEVLGMVPEWAEHKLTTLDTAIEWLTEFQKLYKEQQNETVARIP